MGRSVRSPAGGLRGKHEGVNAAPVDAKDLMKRLICWLGLGASLVISASGAVPPPEKLLPADTVLVVTVPEYAKASETWKQWPTRQLWADPAMKPFREKLVAKFQ